MIIKKKIGFHNFAEHRLRTSDLESRAPATNFVSREREEKTLKNRSRTVEIHCEMAKNVAELSRNELEGETASERSGR